MKQKQIKTIRLKPASVLACLSLNTLLATSAFAATPGVSTGGCEVFSSGIFRNSDYIASYDGGCKDGRANGQGKASWSLRSAPDAPPVVWQGRFVDGVFLAEKQTVGARRLDGSRVLLDLGSLDAPRGAKSGQLWVESRVDNKLPASVCRPNSLQISGNGNLADEALAKGWLDAAYARWLNICTQAAADALKGRQLRVQVHDGAGWSADSFGNIPGGVVQAARPFVVSTANASGKTEVWTQYSNSAAQKVASEKQKQEDDKRKQDNMAEMQANQKRIQAFAKKTGATQYASLSSLDKNPFRFGNEVVLIDVKIENALTPTETWVKPARNDDWNWTRVVLRGPIAHWDENGRIAAVRITGRSKEEGTKGAVILELQDSQRCDKDNCEDYLRMPERRWLNEEDFKKLK